MQTLTILTIDRSDAAARSARATAEAKEISARHLLIATRASLGFILLVSGANGFLHFLPQASQIASLAGDGAVAGFMLSPLTLALQALVGALLLANRYVTAAIAAAAPMVTGLFIIHAMAHARMSLPIVALGLELYLVRACADALRGIRAAL
jgi:hypothetical protein